MTFDGHALFLSHAMAKRRVGSHHPPGSQSVAKMKARQAAKIRAIAEALVTSGLRTLDAQADVLGVCRSTAWTILKGSHKSTGLSAKTIKHILAEPKLPPLVRATILEYIEEKAIGCYGHSERLRRKFITLLLNKRVERADLAELFRLPADAQIVKIASALGGAAQSGPPATVASYARPRLSVRMSERGSADRKARRSRVF
jgi:hypothetical protein